jgi:hypothetical protein
MDKKPDDTKKKYTWRQTLSDLSEGKLKDPVVQQAFADSFKLDIAGLSNEDTQETLFEFIHVHVPVDRWDEVAIWPLPPRKVDNDIDWWKIILTVVAALALVLALFNDNGGPSNQEIRDQARVEVYDKLGIQIVDGNVNVLPDGLMATTAKREACKLTARQSANLRPDLGLDVNKSLAACEAIK